MPEAGDEDADPQQEPDNGVQKPDARSIRKYLAERLPTQKVSIVQEWFELDTKKVVYSGQIWRLLTHAFCHDRMGIFHIFLNMLGLYWFGSTLESMYGSREFLLFYLTAAVVAGLGFVGLELYTGSQSSAIGASGAVMAVMMLYTMHYPYDTIRIFWFFPLEMRWVMLLYVIWDVHPVLLSLSGEHFFDGIGHSAHLGGAAFGFLYAHYHWRLTPIVDRLPMPRSHRRPLPPREVIPFPRRHVKPDAEDARLDELLRKISTSGQTSLTEEETRFLQQASQRRKKKKE